MRKGKDGYEKNDGKKKEKTIESTYETIYIYIYIYLYVKHGGGGRGREWIQSERKILYIIYFYYF